MLDHKLINGLQECLNGAPWGMLWDWLQEQGYHVATPEWQFCWLVGRYGIQPQKAYHDSDFTWCYYPRLPPFEKGRVCNVVLACQSCLWVWSSGYKTPADAYQRLFDNMYKHTCGWLEWLEETKEINPAVPRPLAPDGDWGWYDDSTKKENCTSIMTEWASINCPICDDIWDMPYSNASYPELWAWAESNDHNHPHLDELYAIHHGEIHEHTT